MDDEDVLMNSPARYRGNILSVSNLEARIQQLEEENKKQRIENEHLFRILKLQEEERRLQEEKRRQQDEETRRQQDEIRRQQDEIRRQQDEIRRLQDEIRRLQDEETRRQQDEIRRLQDETRRQQDEIRRQQDEETRRLQDERRILDQTPSTPSISFGEYYIQHVQPTIKVCTIEEWFIKEDVTIFDTKLDLSQSEKLLQQAFEDMLDEVSNELPLQVQNTSHIRYVPGTTNRSPDLSFLPRDAKFQTEVFAKFVNLVGELKKADGNIETHDKLGQICCYLERLSKQNGGKSVYGFITNFRSAIFVLARDGKVLKRTQQFDFVTHQENTVTLNYFKSLLTEAAKKLPVELNKFTMTKYIGEGKTSFVFQVLEDRKKSKKVLKLKKDSVNGWSFKVEAEVLSTLHNKKESGNFIENIPKVEISDCSNFLIFSTQYAPLREECLTKTNVLQFLNFLQFMHSYTIFHRDIRPSNLSYDSAHKSIVLLDFGYAITSNEDQFAGTLTYAPTELLLAILSDFTTFTYELRYESKYDVESFVKSFYVLVKKPIQIALLDRQLAPDALDLMKKIKEVILAWDVIEKSDTKLFRLMNSIRQDANLSAQQLCDSLFDLLL